MKFQCHGELKLQKEPITLISKMGFRGRGRGRGGRGFGGGRCYVKQKPFKLFPSVDNELVLWEPKMKEQSPGEGTDILQKYPVPECDIWFIKFYCDFHYTAAAVGNREGKIIVWEVQSNHPVLVARLTHVQSKSPCPLHYIGQIGYKPDSKGGLLIRKERKESPFYDKTQLY